MKNYWLLISLMVLLSLSCHKNSQKNCEKSTESSSEKKDKKNYQEIHAPISDDAIELNKRKQEQTEKKNQNPAKPKEE